MVFGFFVRLTLRGFFFCHNLLELSRYGKTFVYSYCYCALLAYDPLGILAARIQCLDLIKFVKLNRIGYVPYKTAIFSYRQYTILK